VVPWNFNIALPWLFFQARRLGMRLKRLTFSTSLENALRIPMNRGESPFPGLLGRLSVFS
jgi:hypothetical protein